MPKVFLATINGELVGVMTFSDAIKYAWNMGHASISLEPLNDETETKNKEAQHG